MKAFFRRYFALFLNLVLVLLCALALRRVCGVLTTLDAAKRFRGESDSAFTQLACFLPAGEGTDAGAILRFRQALSAELVARAMTAPVGGRLFLDAYSGGASVTVRTERASATVEALGVGGNFFYFHPLPLLSGAYLREDDLMDDLIVLDEQTAWLLYGGTDLAGMPVSVNGAPFVVAGVVRRETDFASRRACAGGGGVFLSYSALCRLADGVDITCYELVMPEPLPHFAAGVLADRFPVGGEIVENTGRFRPARLWAVARSFGERSMRRTAVAYPYWENAARMVEDYAALLLVLTALFALPLLGRAAAFLLSFTRRRNGFP